jgi:hypothetical protein
MFYSDKKLLSTEAIDRTRTGQLSPPVSEQIVFLIRESLRDLERRAPANGEEIDWFTLKIEAEFNPILSTLDLRINAQGVNSLDAEPE